MIINIVDSRGDSSGASSINNNIINGEGTSSVRMASASTATGTASFAAGGETTASGNYSFAQGYKTSASGNASHAQNYYTIASGLYSHAEGNHSIANGDTSHAQGYGGYTYSNYSHAEGKQTTAYNIGSHSEGDRTLAKGAYSHAEGYCTTANHDYSHVSGDGTITGESRQTVIGSFNSTGKSGLFIIGNGTAQNNRSNALRVDWDGNLNLAGDLRINVNSSQTSATLSSDFIKDTTSFIDNLDGLTKSHHQLTSSANSITIDVRKYFRGLIITSGNSASAQSMYLVYTSGGENSTASTSVQIKTIIDANGITVGENRINTQGIIKVQSSLSGAVMVDVISFNYPVNFI